MPLFQYPIFLYLLPILLVLLLVYWIALNRKKKITKSLGDPALVKQLTANYNRRSFLLKFSLLFVAMAALIFALANPRKATSKNLVSRNGIDVMIAIDVSKSMLAQDIKPNRLERAKQLLSKLIDKLENDRIGIVVFAGKAYMQMPLSSDHAAAKMYLSAATPESIPTQGTVIGDALKMCYAAFNSKEKKYKAVILISDGEDHDESAISTAKQMAAEGVVIHTVGIGSREGAPIIDEATGQMKTDNQGNTVISKLNETILKSISSSSNGIYQFYGSTDNVVSNIAKDLASMDQRTVNDESLINYKTYFQILLILVLVLLVIEMMVRETKRIKKLRIKPAVAAILMMCTCTFAFGQSENKIIKEGNTEYKKNNFTAAKSAYTKVLAKDAKNTTARYNLGNASYKAGSKDSAIVAYDQAINDLVKSEDKAKAYYNKGVVLQKDNKIAECIDAYKNALKLTPNDDDARQNLQKALQQQKQQQQQQDKKEKKDDEKKDKQEPKPQQPKISKKEAEEKLKALMQQEKNLQDKLHKVNAQSPVKPEKDW